MYIDMCVYIDLCVYIDVCVYIDLCVPVWCLFKDGGEINIPIFMSYSFWIYLWEWVLEKETQYLWEWVLETDKM